MPLPHDTTYPVAATNKTWQTKKAAGDKLLIKTGLGDKLTAAETKWKAIPWHDLDVHAYEIDTLEEAEAAHQKAQAALQHVKDADAALGHAHDEAHATGLTRGLSSSTKTAADNAMNALAEARQRLASVNLADFQNAIDDMKATVTLINLLTLQDTVVGSAASGTWDGKELHATGLIWRVGDIDYWKGKTLRVIGGVSSRTQPHAAFRKDLKLESGSGKTATFKV